MKPRIRIIAAMAGLALAAGVTGWTPAGASDITSFEAKAQAEGGRFTFGAPGFVAVDTFIDGGGPVAQSVLDGLGNSQSFASLPYPSDNAISGPGLVAGLTGLPSPPPYPFYVNSSYPTQDKATFAQPGLNLEATSSDVETAGTASSGGGGGGSSVFSITAHTSSKKDDATGSVIAEASTVADMINIGGQLKIASGVVSAKVTRSAGGDPVRESAMRLDGVSIAGQAVGFNDKGFVFAGTGAPIPPDNPLMQALRQAGIDVHYLAPVNDDNGVMSPGLVITQAVQFPGSPKMIFTYVLGRAQAHATVS